MLSNVGISNNPDEWFYNKKVKIYNRTLIAYKYNNNKYNIKKYNNNQMY